MYTDNVEADYMRERAATSLLMARTAASDCARLAHETLARRYEQRLRALRRPLIQA